MVGRSGRGSKPGRAIIQTYTPENETIKQAACQDYLDFYKSEIQLRRLQNLPPFSELFAISVSGQVEEHVVSACRYIKAWLDDRVGKSGRAVILGPSPLPVVKVNNRYRYRVTVSASSGTGLRAPLSQIIIQCSTDKRFADVSVYADNDPLE